MYLIKIINQDKHLKTNAVAYNMIINTAWQSELHYLIFKALIGVHYRNLQARVHEQETRNLTPARVGSSEVIVVRYCSKLQFWSSE